MSKPEYTPIILVVEGDTAVRGMLSGVLKHAGFDVLEAPDGCKALKLYRQHKGAIDLVLMDVGMPDPDGPATLDLLREIDPAVRCCFITGESVRYPDKDLAGRGVAFVLKKPFTMLQLVGTACRLLPSEAPF